MIQAYIQVTNRAYSLRPIGLCKHIGLCEPKLLAVK